MGGGKSKKVRVPVYPAITGPMVSQMVARANQAGQNVNVPTLAELFPYMNQNPFLGMEEGTIPTQNMSGAGRFLGQGMTGMEQAPVYQAPMAQQFSYAPQQMQQQQFNPYNNLSAMFDPGNSGGMLGVAYRQALENSNSNSPFSNQMLNSIQPLLTMATNKS